MLDLNGKKFMNIQEAVQWLLDNNALPFQCSANYIANTEIGLGTIDNPSPAKVKIGSLILFADSKIATVSGLTENGFIVGTQNVNIQTVLNYISNIFISPSDQHLYTLLSNGETIDAGLVRGVESFEINASQHLIVNYNDGTSDDLGAIFTGNISISGNITATGTIDGGTVTGNEIIEKMVGYSFTKVNANQNIVYAGASKTGNKLTLVVFETYTSDGTDNDIQIGYFDIPSAIGSNLYPYTVGLVDYVLNQQSIALFDDNSQSSEAKMAKLEVLKGSNTRLFFNLRRLSNASLENGHTYVLRAEVTFLLSANLAS